VDGRIDLPIACSLEGPGLADRRDDWAALIAVATERRAVLGGVQITFDQPSLRDRIRDLIDKEQECCPWMSMQLSEADGSLSLSISSSDPTGERQIHAWFD